MAATTSAARKRTIMVLADNKLGVLARVTGLFSAKGYDIESLALGPAFDPSIARMTLVVHADDFVIEQVLKQLRRLIDVIQVSDLTDTDFVEREMLLVRLKPEPTERAELLRIAEIFRARVVDVTPQGLTLEATGDGSKTTALIDMLRPFRVQEIVRTGTIAIARSAGAAKADARGRPGKARDAADPARRHYPRHPLRLEVRLPTVDDLSKLWTADISKGGMSLETDREILVGESVQLRLVHPLSGDMFPLRAVVRRRIVQPHFRGLGVEFVDLDEGRRKELAAFIHSEAIDDEADEDDEDAAVDR